MLNKRCPHCNAFGDAEITQVWDTNEEYSYLRGPDAEKIVDTYKLCQCKVCKAVFVD